MSEHTGALGRRCWPEWTGRAPSRRSRVVDAATSVARDCDCGAAVVGVLRGFGHARRAEAAALRRRLRREKVEVRDLAAPMTASAATAASVRGEPLPHVCVYVDATAGTGLDAERVAVVAGVPIVRAGDGASEVNTAPRLEQTPCLRTFFHHDDELQMFPSVSGQVPDVGFDEVRVVPNQPETGQLRLTVGDSLPVTLETGTELVVRPLPGLAHVVSRPMGGEPRTWMTEEVRVAGLWPAHRGPGRSPLRRSRRCPVDRRSAPGAPPLYRLRRWRAASLGVHHGGDDQRAASELRAGPPAHVPGDHLLVPVWFADAFARCAGEGLLHDRTAVRCGRTTAAGCPAGAPAWRW